MTEAISTPLVYGSNATQLREALRTGQVPVAVYGLGKMGLPLAAVLADTCGNVTGVDVDSTVVKTVNNRGCHVENEPGLPGMVDELVGEDLLEATTNGVAAAEDARVHVVIVPTPITDAQQPDLAILDSAVATIGRGLSAGDLVIIESTVPPGTTAGRVKPMLAQVSGLESGRFGVAFCPERTSSGRAIQDIEGAYPKVVGGVDQASTDAAAVLYEEVNDKGVLRTHDATTAEAVKVFEGVYRDVNIALANELARLTDELDIDVREAIDVANTQPFCDIHDPGPGVGGHCIPYYPYFLTKPLDGPTELMATARAVNDAMPAFTVSKLREEFAADGTDLAEATVAILGLTYRPGVDEIRASPAKAIAEELSIAGADVLGVDPICTSMEAFDLEPVAMDTLYERSVDGVVVVTPHRAFDNLRWEAISRETGDVVVIDGRDSLSSADIPHRVYTIGRGHV